MELKAHIINTKGKGGEIHEYMDQFWDKFEEDHHVILHNKKGVDFLIDKFGEESRWIIMQHLKDDKYGEGQRRLPESPEDSCYKDWAGYLENARQFASDFYGG